MVATPSTAERFRFASPLYGLSRLVCVHLFESINRGRSLCSNFNGVRPNETPSKLFAFDDDYSASASFNRRSTGAWTKAKGGRLKKRYSPITSKVIWKTFPWPQEATLDDVVDRCHLRSRSPCNTRPTHGRKRLVTSQALSSRRSRRARILSKMCTSRARCCR